MVPLIGCISWWHLVQLIGASKSPTSFQVYFGHPQRLGVQVPYQRLCRVFATLMILECPQGASRTPLCKALEEIFGNFLEISAFRTPGIPKYCYENPKVTRIVMTPCNCQNLARLYGLAVCTAHCFLLNALGWPGYASTMSNLSCDMH